MAIGLKNLVAKYKLTASQNSYPSSIKKKKKKTTASLTIKVWHRSKTSV